MLEAEILGRLDTVDFAPGSELKEILQNVKMILTTPKFSVPLDRNFGLSVTMIDAPLPAAQAKLTAEIIDAVQKYEPRVKVTKVTYEADTMDGILRPKVKVKLSGT